MKPVPVLSFNRTAHKLLLSSTVRTSWSTAVDWVWLGAELGIKKGVETNSGAAVRTMGWVSRSKQYERNFGYRVHEPHYNKHKTDPEELISINNTEKKQHV